MAGLGQAKPGHRKEEQEAVSGAATPVRGAGGAWGLKHSKNHWSHMGKVDTREKTKRGRLRTPLKGEETEI